MTLIDRYISAIKQYLPADRREEIARELYANILDRLEHLQEENGSMAGESEVAEVLREIGHPQQVAGRFLPSEQLVSVELFPHFKTMFYYTLVVFFIIHLVKTGAVFLQVGSFSFRSLLFGFTDTALLIFASLTGIFYILSNPPGGKPWFTPYANWKPEQLPPVGQSWQRIRFGEQASELALQLFLLLVLHYSLWASADALDRLRVVFAEPVAVLIPWMTALVVFGVLLNLWNFRFSYWTGPKLLISGLINTGSALILIAVSRLSEIIALTPDAEMKIWNIEAANQFAAVGLLLGGVALLYEAGKNFYRVYRLRASAG